MAEIERKPLRIFIDGQLPYCDVADVELKAFDDNHTFADVARWIISEGGREEVQYFLGDPDFE